MQSKHERADALEIIKNCFRTFLRSDEGPLSDCLDKDRQSLASKVKFDAMLELGSGSYKAEMRSLTMPANMIMKAPRAQQKYIAEYLSVVSTEKDFITSWDFTQRQEPQFSLHIFTPEGEFMSDSSKNSPLDFLLFYLLNYGFEANLFLSKDKTTLSFKSKIEGRGLLIKQSSDDRLTQFTIIQFEDMKKFRSGFFERSDNLYPDLDEDAYYFEGGPSNSARNASSQAQSGASASSSGFFSPQFNDESIASSSNVNRQKWF